MAGFKSADDLLDEAEAAEDEYEAQLAEYRKAARRARALGRRIRVEDEYKKDLADFADVIVGMNPGDADNDRTPAPGDKPKAGSIKVLDKRNGEVDDDFPESEFKAEHYVKVLPSGKVETEMGLKPLDTALANMRLYFPSTYVKSNDDESKPKSRLERILGTPRKRS